MPPEIFMSIIGALYLLLVAVLSYIWVSSERRNEKRLAEINERIEFISNSFTESLDKVYSEIRKVVSQGVEAERRFLQYQLHAEERYARKEEVREMKNHLCVVRP